MQLPEAAAIQAAFHAGRAQCLQAGVLVADRRDQGGPLTLEDLAADARPGAIRRDALMRAIDESNCHTAVIESAGACLPDPAWPARLAPLVEDFSIDVVCQLARPDHRVESLYALGAWAGAGACPSLSDFARSPVVRAGLDYHALLCRWREMPARVAVLDPAGGASAGEDLDRFIQAARLPDLELSPVPVEPLPDLRLALLQARLLRDGVAFDPDRLSLASRQMAAGGGRAPLRHGLGARERANLLQTLAPSLGRLDAEFGVRFPASLPPGEPTEPVADDEMDHLIGLLAVLSQHRPMAPRQLGR